jgi:hypothetical protein
MAKVIEWSNEQKKAWDEWVASRPPIIQEMCRRFPPCNLYRLKTTGSRVTLYSYSENGTLTVNVTGEYNAVMFNRQVFGIKPDDLEECDLPSAEEITGTVLTEKEDVDSYIDIIRPAIFGHKNLDA